MRQQTITKIGNLGRIITGKTPSTLNPDFYGGTIPFITPTDMVGTKTIVKTQRYLSTQGRNSVNSSYIPPHSICVSCIGSDMGKVVMTHEWAVTNQQINSIIVNESFDYRYIYYLMRTLENRIRNLGKNSTAVPILNKTKFSNIEIKVFCDLEYQTRIADILSAYDDLIENNQKQIKLLEEAAQRLYKEWFIDLHFPGHETTPIVNGIPAGWERKTVEKCLVMTIGGGWGKDEPIGNYLHKGRVIRGTDIPDVYYGNYRDVPLRYHTEKDIQTRSLQENDIIFELSNGNIGNIGRCLLIGKEMLQACGESTICASFCKLLRPINESHALLLFLEIQAMQYNGTMLPLKKHGANGINNFDLPGFLQHDILVPNDIELLDPIKAITAKISTLREQLRLLTEARDRLLPKLMSGEIEV